MDFEKNKIQQIQTIKVSVFFKFKAKNKSIFFLM